MAYVDIRVHYRSDVYAIPAVDMDRYSYMDLLTAICDRALNAVDTSANVLIRIATSINHSTEVFFVESDADVMKMFNGNVGEHHIDVFVTTNEAPAVASHFPQPSQPPQQPINVSDDEIEVDDIGSEDGSEDWAEKGGYCGEGEGQDEVYSFTDDSDEDRTYIVHENEEGDGDIDDEHDGDSGDDYILDELSDYQSNSNELMTSFEDEDFQADPNRFMRGKKPVEDDGRNVSFWVGRVFVSVDAFREKLREYVIQEGFGIVRVKNERTRVTVKCAGEGCRWRIHAAPTPDSSNFVVRTLTDEHSCIRSTKNKNASSSWIAKKFASRIKNNPEMKLSGMRNELLEEYGVEVHPMRLYRAKKKCMDAIEGNHGECYGKFPAYADVVTYHNPRSLLKLQCERLHMTSNPTFKNFFVCLEAMKTGFINGCRPFLGLDGCHFKGPYGGVLLGAVALDGNHKLFPVAWAVVDGETKENWRFFLYHLHMVLGDDSLNRPFTFMTDRQKLEVTKFI